MKSGGHVDKTELAGLRSFVQEHAPRRAVVVTTEPRRRQADGIVLLPWLDFLHDLWAGKIV